jgi:hypothetical protein
MSADTNNRLTKTIQILATMATIIGTCIAVIALIPAFGQWLNPREPAPSIVPPTSTSVPIIQSTSTFQVASGTSFLDMSKPTITVVPHQTEIITVLVDDSSSGYYSKALGTTLDGTQPQFPPANISGGDPTIFPASEPNLSLVNSVFGDWLSSTPVPLNSNWSTLQVIPHRWAANTEVAVIYPIDGGTKGISQLIGNFGVDNGIFVWVNGVYKFGALAPGGGANYNEYPNVNLDSLPSGLNYIQILLEDHGDSGVCSLQILGLIIK